MPPPLRRDRLHRVRWIGGSPCSGKSTVAALLAAARGLTPYTCDDAFARHAAGATFAEVAALPIGVRLGRPVELQVADVLQLYRDEFPAILDDLAALAEAGPVVAEGAALLPELLAAHGVPPEHAVWIVPTEKFQRDRYARRTWARELLAVVDDRDAAFEQWMRRDAAFARLVAGQATAAGYRVVTVDGSVPPETVSAAVEAFLARAD